MVDASNEDISAPGWYSVEAFRMGEARNGLLDPVRCCGNGRSGGTISGYGFMLLKLDRIRIIGDGGAIDDFMCQFFPVSFYYLYWFKRI